MKNNLKRLFSLLLVFTLCFGLAMPAFAEGGIEDQEEEEIVQTEPEPVVEQEPEETEFPETDAPVTETTEPAEEAEEPVEEEEEELLAEVSGEEPVSVVPVIRITTVNGKGNSLKKADGYAAVASVLITDANGETNVSRETQEDQIKVRGNSTADAEKKPFTLKFSKKTNVLGMGKAKKWNLLANCFDPSMLRNYTALELAQMMGLEYTPDQQFVELYLDGVYKGLYLLTEAVEIGDSRVNINTADGDFMIEYERDRKESETTYITTNGLRFVAKDPEYEDFLENPAMLEHIQETVAKFGAALDSGDYAQVCEIVDVESIADYYLLNEFMKNVDVGFSSVNFYYSNGQFHGGPAWDYDLSSGNAGLLEPSHRPYFAAGSDKSYIGLYAVKHVFQKLLQYPEFRTLVAEALEYHMDTFRSLVGDNGLIKTTAADLRPVINKNFASKSAGGAGWVVSKSYSLYMYTPGKTYDENFNYFYNWIVNRISWMENGWAAAICAETAHTLEVDELTATCGKAGYYDSVCLLCGETKHADYPATGKHSYTDWVEVTAPVDGKPGVERRVCRDCGKEETREFGVCEAEKSVAPMNGTLDLYLKGTFAGSFTFTKVTNGWTIQDENGLYLTAESGKLVRKAASFTWTYGSNAFSVSQKKAPTSIWESIFGTKSTTYYLASASSVSTSKVTAELIQHVSLASHAFGAPVSKRGGTHTVTCTNCGVMEEYDCEYNAQTHKCVCGAVEPSSANVTISAKVTKSTQKYLIFFTKTTYKATITTQAEGTTVKTVEYSTDGGKTWTKGTSFTSTSEIKSFLVRATDANGNVYNYSYPA